MPEDQSLHVVAFNIPYPPDYGGIIDIYFKLKALHAKGIRLKLHCFQYDRKPDPELESICEQVWYYPRKRGPGYFISKLPYIVNTRVSEELEKNLLVDKDPVLFEGLHTTFLLDRCRAEGKIVAVRTHNIEHNYYRMLSRSATDLYHKLYLRIEANRLMAYESVLKHADHILSISTTDAEYFTDTYKRSHFIPAFQNQNEVTSKAGKGDFILFHGNLSVPENDRAVRYLISSVISRISHRTIVAGKDPGRSIRKLCDRYAHVELISSPGAEQMKQLIQNAHINLLYTYQPTGLKLKLLHSLYGGRYCLANPLMLSGSGLEDLCEIYSTPSQAIAMIDQLMGQVFAEESINKRIAALSGFDNLVNAERIASIIFSH